METTHPDTNVLLEISKCIRLVLSRGCSRGRGDVTNIPSDTDTVAPLLNANTVILRYHTPLLMEKPHRGKSQERQTNEIY